MRRFFLALGCLTPALALAVPTVSAGVQNSSPDGRTVVVNGVFSNGFGLLFDWGDGDSTDGFFPTAHHYLSSGNFTIRVTAYGTDGTTASAAFLHLVPPHTGQVASVTMEPPFVGLKPGGSTTARMTARDAAGAVLSLQGRTITFLELPTDSGGLAYITQSGDTVTVTAGALSAGRDAWTTALRFYVDNQESNLFRVAVKRTRAPSAPGTAS